MKKTSLTPLWITLVIIAIIAACIYVQGISDKSIEEKIAPSPTPLPFEEVVTSSSKQETPSKKVIVYNGGREAVWFVSGKISYFGDGIDFVDTKGNKVHIRAENFAVVQKSEE